MSYYVRSSVTSFTDIYPVLLRIPGRRELLRSGNIRYIHKSNIRVSAAPFILLFAFFHIELFPFQMLTVRIFTLFTAKAICCHAIFKLA